MRNLGETVEVLAGVYWIEDAGPCSGSYFLEGDGILVDTGNMYGLLDEISTVAPVERIRTVLLTHAHFDHVGGMAEIFQMVSPEVVMHPLSREYARLLKAPFPQFFDALEQEGKLRVVQDGDVIGRERPLQVLHLPGHTAGDLGFYDPKARALFAGDVVLPHTLRFAAILAKPDEVCGGRMKEKVESLRRLLHFPVDHLLAGHGEPILGKGGNQIRIALTTLYQALYDHDPVLPWIFMGRDLLEAGHPEEARACLTKARSIDPHHEEIERMEQAFVDGRE